LTHTTTELGLTNITKASLAVAEKPRVAQYGITCQFLLVLAYRLLNLNLINYSEFLIITILSFV